MLCVEIFFPFFFYVRHLLDLYLEPLFSPSEFCHYSSTEGGLETKGSDTVLLSCTAISCLHTTCFKLLHCSMLNAFFSPQEVTFCCWGENFVHGQLNVWKLFITLQGFIRGWNTVRHVWFSSYSTRSLSSTFYKYLVLQLSWKQTQSV